MKLYEKVFYIISGHGRGWAFSSIKRLVGEAVAKNAITPDRIYEK